jgi:hypothetical protein
VASMCLGIGSSAPQNQTSICCLGSSGRVVEVEFVFSASPETIQGESRECDLLRLVGNRQSSQPARWEPLRAFSDCGFPPSDKTTVK